MHVVAWLLFAGGIALAQDPTPAATEGATVAPAAPADTAEAAEAAEAPPAEAPRAEGEPDLGEGAEEPEDEPDLVEDTDGADDGDDVDDAEGAGPPAAMARFLANELVQFGAANDVFAMGNTVEVTEPVGDNVVMMGRGVEVTEEVGGDAIAMGQRVVIDAPIRGDLYAMGADVTVTNRGSVGGIVYGIGNTVTLDGPVASSVVARGRTVRLGSTIGGSADVDAVDIVVGDDTRVAGNMHYVAASRYANLSDVVDGEVRFSLGEREAQEAGSARSLLLTVVETAVKIGVSYLGKLAVGAILLVFGGSLVRGPSLMASDQPLIATLLGVALFLVVAAGTAVAGLIAVRVELASVAALTLGVVGIAILSIGLYIAQLIAAMALGDTMLTRFRPSMGGGRGYVALAAGLIPLVLLEAIPAVDYVVWGLATLIGFGGTWLYLRTVAKVPAKV